MVDRQRAFDKACRGKVLLFRRYSIMLALMNGIERVGYESGLSAGAVNALSGRTPANFARLCLAQDLVGPAESVPVFHIVGGFGCDGRPSPEPVFVDVYPARGSEAVGSALATAEVR